MTGGRDIEVIVQVERASKTFHLDVQVSGSILSNFLSLLSWSSSRKREFKVLDEVTFNVRQGEVLGVIGRNGSGKSTLLRAMAGIYHLTSGYIETNGEVFYLAGMGQGLVSKLTMRENIYLIGSVLGLSRNEILNKFSMIVEFAGLEEFIDVKVYQFSSGMLHRLAFSIMVHCLEDHRADIFLLDEALATTADAEFSEKAMIKIGELIRRGATIVLVSHQPHIVRRFCARAIWLEKGKIVEIGEANETIEHYLDFVKAAKLQHAK